MKFFFTALFALSLANAFAQTPDSAKTASPLRRNDYETYQSTSQLIGSGPYSMITTVDQRYEGFRGTPYFLPEWNKGQIEIVSGKHYTNVPIKFDAYRQQLILLRPTMGNDSIIVNAAQVKSFQFANSTGQLFLFKRLPDAKTDDNLLKEGYFMVLYQGKSALLKRIAKTFKQADYKGAYTNDVRYDAYQNVFSYYLLKPDQSLTKVKLSEKSLSDALNDRKDELKAFMKQENVTVKTEDDAIKLMKKYDSL